MTSTLLSLLLIVAAGADAALAPEREFSLRAAQTRTAIESHVAALRTETGRSPAPEKEFVLRVLSYNIYGIPLFMGQPDPPDRHDRYRDIGRILARLRAEGRAPHIVAIQESFHPRTEELPREAGYPYMAEGAPERRPGLLNSGLVILSEFPLEARSTVNYKDCMGMDCYANKGALHVRVRIPGLPVPLELFDTHLNADVDGPSPPPEETMKIRISQIGQLTEFMRREIAPGAPALFPGDFNFKPAGADYRLFSRFPGVGNAAQACSRGGCTGAADPAAIWRDSVDHHFFIPGGPPPMNEGGGTPGSHTQDPGSVSIVPVHVEQTFKDPVNGQPPSDHLGLEAWFRLSW